MQLVYRVDDCLDGLEFILNYSKENLVKHSEIYKESYRLSLSFVDELERDLQSLLNFPFYQLMDDKILDISYRYANNFLQTFLRSIETYVSLNQVNSPREALKQYEILQVEVSRLHNFMSELRNQLAKVYFSRTGVHLLTLPTKLYKRHLIIQLYSS